MAYTGPGDLKTFTGWWGLRAYSAATAGNNCADIAATSSGAVTTVKTLANGNFDVASANAALGGNAGFISKLYDQTGNGHDVTQATAANKPKITLNALQGGTLPEINMTGAVQFATSFFLSDAGTFTVTNPWTMVAAVKPGGNWTAIFRPFLGTGNLSQGLVYSSATQFQLQNDSFSGPAARTWSIGNYHRVIGVNVNSAAALTSLDGSVVTYTGSTSAWLSAGISLGESEGAYDISGVEFGVAASAFSSSDATAMDSNINNYWFVTQVSGIAVWPIGM